jgi:eukaryotic-like serine/threonine-protein kinase
MASPVDGKQFLDLVRKSEVADGNRLEAFLEQQRGSLPPEPSRIADMLIGAGLLTPFQADAILQGRWKRFTIGKYRILDKLGAGGMAIVYLCEHKLMRRRVAVKVLPAAKAANPTALERFYREARAVAALDHPNIVHAYDIDHDENLHFLVMEYVEGSDLQDMVKKHGPLSVDSACHYIRQSALGLDHARQRGLVHRDIKPGNILVDSKGQVKILDMGLARYFHDDEAILTNKFDENVLGTADYLAPEQAEDSHEVDIRADIYSLGATFYFLLTGKTLFGEGTVSQKLMWHQHNQPRPITELRPDVPPTLAAIVMKMVAKAPGQRYQVPSEVAEALTQYVPPAMLARLTEKDAVPLTLAAAGASPPSGVPAADQAPVPVATLVQAAQQSVVSQVPAARAAADRNRTILFALLGAGIFLLFVLVVVMIKFVFFSSSRTSTSLLAPTVVWSPAGDADLG